MDDRDFKINLAFHEYCSILNEILSLSLVFSFCFSVPDRDFRSSIDLWKDTGGDRVENYEKIVRCFIERVEMIERERRKFFYVFLDDRVKINKVIFKMELMDY